MSWPHRTRLSVCVCAYVPAHSRTLRESANTTSPLYHILLQKVLTINKLFPLKLTLAILLVVLIVQPFDCKRERKTDDCSFPLAASRSVRMYVSKQARSTHADTRIHARTALREDEAASPISTSIGSSNLKWQQPGA